MMVYGVVLWGCCGVVLGYCDCILWCDVSTSRVVVLVRVVSWNVSRHDGVWGDGLGV